MIDFHCHLDLYPDPKSVIAGCVQRGMFVLAVTTTPLAWEGNQALVADSPRIRVAPGLHPELVLERHSELSRLLALVKLTRYVGEIGLDGGPKLREHLALQERVFRAVLATCADNGRRVISIHSRNATQRVLDGLEEYSNAGVFVLHWYSGTLGELARAAKLGCWFSVGPAMLSSAKGARIAAMMPRDRVLTETDAPFAQFRGKPLMPWDACLAEAQLADIWRVSEQTVRVLIQDNLRRLASQAREFPVAMAE